MSPTQIADMLSGTKSFGEKVARKLEALAKMPELWLDRDDVSDEPRLSYHGVMLTRAGALLGAEWEKLDVSDRIEMQLEIEARVKRKKLAERDAAIEKPT